MQLMSSLFLHFCLAYILYTIYRNSGIQKSSFKQVVCGSYAWL